MALTAQAIADRFDEDRIRKARNAPGLTESDHKLLDEALALKNPPLTGERKAKLDADIAAGTSPEPGGQWAQSVERWGRGLGVIGNDNPTPESTAGAIGHQLSATAYHAANTVIPYSMTTLANLGDLSDALLQNRGGLTRAANAVPNILPRSQPTREYLETAPSPLAASLGGAAVGMTAQMPSEVLEAPNAAAPVPPNATEAVRRGLNPMPVTNSPVANQVALNTVLGGADELQQSAAEGRDPSLVNLGKRAFDPTSIVPVAAAGLKTRPYTETQSFQRAQRYGKLRREGGGQVPREYTRASGAPAIELHEAEGNAAIAEAKDAGRLQQERVAQQEAGNVDKVRESATAARAAAAERAKAAQAQAEAAGKREVESAAAQGERTFSAGDRAANKQWFGNKGEPGAFEAERAKLLEEGVRADPTDVHDALDASVQKYAATSEPIEQTPGGGEKRMLSLGSAVRGAAESVKSYLGANPNLADYQNALQELGKLADGYNSSPAAKRAFTELAAIVREDSYAKIPGWRELAEKNRQFMETQERGQQIVYGGDDVANATGTREGGSSMLPASMEKRGARNLMNVDESVKDTEFANELSRLTDFGRRAVESVRAAKQRAGQAVQSTKELGDQDVALTEEVGADQLTAAERAAERRKWEARRASETAVEGATRTKEERLANQDAVDAARLSGGKLGQLALEAGFIAGGLSHGAGYMAIPLTIGTVGAAKTLSPWVRARAAYLLGEPNIDPQTLRTAMPALSGPLAMGNLDLTSAAAEYAKKKGFGDRAKEAFLKALANAEEEKRKQTEATQDVAKAVRENQP